MTKSPTANRRRNEANNRNRAVRMLTITTANMSCAALDRAGGDTISGKNEVAMIILSPPGFVLLVVALVLALDASTQAIERLAQSEGYTDIQNVMAVTNAS